MSDEQMPDPADTPELSWAERTPGYDTPGPLRCDVCGTIAVLSPREAFDANWDALPWYTGYTKCESCPATALFGL